jgi:hypothetical protein
MKKKQKQGGDLAMRATESVVIMLNSASLHICK